MTTGRINQVTAFWEHECNPRVATWTRRRPWGRAEVSGFADASMLPWRLSGRENEANELRWDTWTLRSAQCWRPDPDSKPC